MAELVDALASGASGGNTVQVQVLFRVPRDNLTYFYNMKITEILGDSLREDLNFISSKVKDLPKNKSVVFVGESLELIPKIKEAPAFSKIEVDVEDENRYKIYFQGAEIYFILSKNLTKFKNFDYIFLIDLNVLKKAKKMAKEKVFLLTSRKKQLKALEDIREEENPEIIQLGLPNSWIDF